MSNDVTMMIRCNRCEQGWDIDYEHDTCECDDDSQWQLMVIPNE